MITRSVSGQSYTLTYDKENRLTNITGSGSNDRYVYDGDGNRILAVENGITTVYIGDYFEAELGAGTTYPVVVPDLILSELPNKLYLPMILNGTGTGGGTPQVGTGFYLTHPIIPNQQSITWHMYYYASGQRVAMRVAEMPVSQPDPNPYPAPTSTPLATPAVGATAGEVYFLLSDHLGSTTVTLNLDGSVKSEIRYSAWGETRYTSGATPTERHYTGQIEEEAGLYFYNARWYDSSLGRFIQADTIVPQPGNPLGWDRFVYSNNAPITFNDPTGHFVMPCNLCSILIQFYQSTMQTIGRTMFYQNTEADSVGDLMLLAFFQEPSATITGEALEDIASDKTMQSKQNDMVNQIISDPRYRKERFSGDYGAIPITFGEMGNNNMLEDATHSQTWTVRAAKVSTTFQVTNNGDIEFNYSLDDTLDLVPDWYSGARTGFSGFLYNVTTSITGAVWHGLLGARKIETNTYWTTYEKAE